MNWKIQWKRKGKHMSKMMIVAATSEKMLELMDKITIEEGVISFWPVIRQRQKVTVYVFRRGKNDHRQREVRG